MLQHARHSTFSFKHLHILRTFVYMHMWVIFQLILIINLIRKSMNERERNKQTQLGKSLWALTIPTTSESERENELLERCGNKNNDNSQVRCAYNKNISVTCLL